MKRKLILFLFLTGVSLYLHAIPAKPGKTRVVQPDGSTVTLVLHGDEFNHFTTTADSYTVVETASGYQYALKQGGSLVPSGVTAHDAAERNSAEREFLATSRKMLRADVTEQQKQERARARSMWKAPSGDTAPARATRYDYGNFRGLVILVEWNDLSFTRTDAKEFFSSMMNDKGYGGYYTQGTPRQWVECTGSVHDYFSDNSAGMFQPEFDVVGPVKINRSHTFPQGSKYGWQCAVDAIEAANPLVDYSKYDADGDGVVDMFYIIYAGYGSNVSGNSSSYIWPYASQYPYPYQRYDGKRMGRYACSTEICDSEVRGGRTLDGIGTICHEFSHVLGLPDLYDTDYEENGQSNDPGVWSIMAGGGYSNSSRTPTGYGAYERYAIGFMKPQLIKEEGTQYTLGAINETNTAYRINSAVDKEYFLLENRQRTRWDAYLPGSGMLVFRVDSTNASVWTANDVNVNPDHNYYEMVRANPRTAAGVITPSGYDPFPGLGNVTELNSEMVPLFKSWSGEAVPLSLNTITESNGIISFSVGGSEIDRKVEDFEAMELTEGDATGVKGIFCNWDMVKTKVVETTDKYGNASKALGIVRGGSLTSSAIEKGISNIEFDYWNASPVQAIVRCYSSTDGGTTWTLMENTDRQTQLNVVAGKNIHTKYIANLPAGSMFRIQQDSGLPTTVNYIDDISMIFNSSSATGINSIEAGSDADTATEAVYNLSGQRVSSCSKGILIVRKRTADGKVITRKVVKR